MSNAIHRQGSVHSSGDKRIATIRFVLLGSTRRTAEATGIPVRALYDWQRTGWRGTLVAQVCTEVEGEIDTTLSKMIQLVPATTMDRLENGDYVVTAKDKIVRKPVSACDIMAILATAIDRRQVLRGAMATVPQQRLGNLADRLREFREHKGNAASPV